MKITILNGSPKGEMSVTMQYVDYIRKLYSQHEYRAFKVAQDIRSIEKNTSDFDTIIDTIRASDAVIWAFPLYILHVHANYKRFIELIFERNASEAFAGKYAVSITTSIKFFDNTANDYMQAISEDLNMHFAGFYAAAMDDLFKADKRIKISAFAKRLFEAFDHKESFCRRFAKIERLPGPYQAGKGKGDIDTEDKKIVIIADKLEEGTNLAEMLRCFRSQFTREPELIELTSVDIKGGCLGCLRCGYDNTCAWQGKDGFIDMYNEKLKTADIIVFAGKIHDRYLSAAWKNFFDRSFFNTHQPSLAGKQWCFLVSGPLRQCETLRTIFQAWTEFQNSSLAGIVTDEDSDSTAIDAAIHNLAHHSVWAARNNYITTETFLKIGGMKIFRDDIFSQLRIVFRGDHLFYKKNGYYDFPNKKMKYRILNFIVPKLMAIRPIRERFYTKEIIPGMIAGYKKILARAADENN